MKASVYTIGYQKLSLQAMIAELKACGIDTLLDVRSKPYSRKKDFNRKNLEKILPAAGIQYMWVGDWLGGFSKISEKSIHHLAEYAESCTACLMCMEADPDQCHRSYEIGRRLAAYDVGAHHLVF